MKKILFLFLFVFIKLSMATQFFEEKGICPMCQDSVSTWGIVSYGSYIYEWDSKYNLVYWPFTEEEWYWSCSTCGYAQIAGDFFNIDSTQKQILLDTELRDWEKKTDNAIKLQSFEQKLLHVRNLNIALHRDDNFWFFFNRVLINQFASKDSVFTKQIANQQLDIIAKGNLSSPIKKEILYLTGEYHRLTENYSEASDNLYKSIFIPYTSKSKIIYYLIIGLLVLLILAMWAKLRVKIILKVVFSMVIVLSIGYIGITQLRNNDEYANTYLNKLAIQRLAKLL